MNTTSEYDAQMARMTFASAYPHYITEVERKGKTKEELYDFCNSIYLWYKHWADKPWLPCSVSTRTVSGKQKLGVLLNIYK